MTSLPTFLTLWILVMFVGSWDGHILMIKVPTKRQKSPKTMRFDYETIEI